MTVTVRFAPSPTGYLHIGNARPALLNFLFARARGGRFILRYDDTDRERSTDAFAHAIAEDLDWLGIVPDLSVRQSDRLERYAQAAERLKAEGRLYPAYETPDELERRRKRQMARGLPPVYDRAALRLSDEERASLEAQGRRPHWRFRLDGRRVDWMDAVRGASHIETGSLSDPVLIREDGTPLYTFTSVVDDVDMGVTDVIRGEDHVTNTAVQIELFEALGARPPRFAHHNLLTTASGEGLSKRLGHLSLRGLRERGFEPLAVATLAVLAGTAEAVRPMASLGELAGLVALDRISRAPARFDPLELEALNARFVHGLPYAAARSRLAAAGADLGEDFWQAVRANCVVVADAAAFAPLIAGPVAPVVAEEDRAFVAQARAALPEEPWGAETWAAWTDALKAATGRKGKALFMPLRRALTGLDHGPELAPLLPLIGRTRVLERLAGG